MGDEQAKPYQRQQQGDPQQRLPELPHICTPGRCRMAAVTQNTGDAGYRHSTAPV
jgi:hypothetical protein